MSVDVKAQLEPHLEELRTRFFVKRIGIFGSHARGEAGPNSDVDVLVVDFPASAQYRSASLNSRNPRHRSAAETRFS